ncbi:HNH endonuclease family protein [Solwaraspora sp. WMMD791]|uniref:HNH endonuclease family protein n=1 Tax=Solwaraspora sp. WMMD791 TaxID=3016086 RepID=UPI00249CF19C|nr:HNH endonuclease family protein [Solwaraspora sp. WMMD791]WFE26207.1 HNH endonuclease family protein [Solwaraspora sp. WMMD791]
MRTPQQRHLPTDRLPLRRAVVAVAAALALTATTGCESVDISLGAPSAAPPVDAPAAGSADEATALLDQLTVAAAGSMQGYSRDRFPHWSSAGSNCDVRDTVLERDGTAIELDGCNVVGGEWLSAFDGQSFTNPRDLDIDHIVPLANAWRSGADSWNDDQRREFANDLERPQLIAVSASSNRAKGDQDPSQWQPPNRDYWCQYAQDWITVKHYWELSVTQPEKATLADMLATCP